MKNFITLFFCVLAITASSQLNYAESTTDLGIPELDGGRTELEYSDINQDGNLDILSLGDHGSPYINTQQHGIMVWLGDVNGEWTETAQFTVPDNGNGQVLRVGSDIDHNGKPERLGFLEKHSALDLKKNWVSVISNLSCFFLK